MAESRVADVLVVGAGPVGLLLAGELARRGVAVRIVDKLPTPSPHSRAVGVASRTLEIFEDLGIVEQALAAGLIGRFSRIYVNGKETLAVPQDGFDAPYPFSLHITQPDTERLLAEHLAKHGGTVERGVELVRLSQDADAVRATLRHADGRDEVVTTRYAVGCDGAHSATRKQVGVPFEGGVYPVDLLLADAVLDWPVPHDGVARFYGDGPLLVAVTIPEEGRFRITAPLIPAAEEGVAPPVVDPATIASDSYRAPPPRAEIAQLIRERSGLPAKVRRLIWTSYFRISLRLAARYRVGRVFLAGDAAHLHPPTGGQGMNTGIQDAYNLGWKLALALQAGAGPALLDSYHAERHPVGEATVRRTHEATTEGMTPAQDLERERRAAVVNAMLQINYRGSPLVAGGIAGAAVQPGERAPDADLIDAGTGRPVRLFERFHGTHFTLLRYAAQTGADAAAADMAALTEVGQRRLGRQLTAALVLPEEAPRTACRSPALLDTQGTFRRRYGIDGDAVLLVRPDKYLGFTGQPGDRNVLEAYLQQMLHRP